VSKGANFGVRFFAARTRRLHPLKFNLSFYNQAANLADSTTY